LVENTGKLVVDEMCWKSVLYIELCWKGEGRQAQIWYVDETMW